MIGNRTPDRSTLRLADLKQRRLVPTRTMNVKVPAVTLEVIGHMAKQLKTSKTALITVLLDAGLQRLAQPKIQRRK